MGEEKEELLEKLQYERAFFENTINKLSKDQICEVEVIDHWTTKDIIGHVTAWEEELLRWFDQAHKSLPPDIPEPGGWTPFIESFNRNGYLKNQNRPLAEILQDFNRVYKEVLAAFQEMPFDQHDEFWTVWFQGEPPWILFGTFHEHYREHGEQIATAFASTMP